MGNVAFDAAAADRLVSAASRAADRLRGQGWPRRGDAELALEDFEGGHARRFEECLRIEAHDRPTLARVLDDLAEQVRVVAESAAVEQRRRDDLCAWQDSAAERDRVAADPVAAFTVAVFDPRPSTTPVRPAPFDAAFTARERPRSGSGPSSGRSSADPQRLRRFAQQSRGADRALDGSRDELRRAWSGFRDSCTWAPVGAATFLQGFDRLLSENAEDAAWIDRIADAFDRAGGGESIADATLDIAATLVLPAALRRVLADGLPAAEAASLWAEFAAVCGSRADVRALPSAVLAQLGNLEGLPYWVRDTANRVILTQRLAALAKLPGAGETLAALRQIHAALRSAAGDAPRSLVSLTADEPPLAAISIGDLDTATNVTWAVPGMGSSTRSMGAWTDASQNVYEQQGRYGGAPQQRAVIAWLGYVAPPQPGSYGIDLGVFGTGYARPGGDRLAASILGLQAARRSVLPATNVLAHSYGSTTAAFGLTKKGVHVDSFTTIGSAGIPDEITGAQAIHADRVHAGQARNVLPFIEPGKGDQWAHVGRDNSTDHRQDPIDPDFGATAFGTDGTDGLKGVTDHGVLTDDESGYLDPDTESLVNVGFATTGRHEHLTEHRPARPTPLQQSLVNGPGAPR